VTKNNGLAEGPDGLVYTARLPLSSATLNYLATLIRGHLKKIGSPWRALPPGKIAGIVLAVLRCDQRPGDLAGGNGVHRTTVTRWVREVVGLLAARAPRLDRALKKIARSGGGVVLLDGSLIRTRRRTGTANRKNYSACRHDHLTDRLRAAGDGRLSAGDRLPPESDLIIRYGVSRPTVREALGLLENQGLIVRRHGIGNFVRRPGERIIYSNDRLAANRRAAINAAVRVNVSGSKVRADARLSALMEVPRETRLHKYVYLSRHETSPYSLAHIYVPCGVIDLDLPESSSSPLGDDIRERIAEAGIQLAATISRITARPPDSEEARTLRIGTGTAVLAVERTSMDNTGRVVEAALLVLPGYNAEAVFTTHSAVNELEAAR
jgi:DNA-binding GntR family transcriptional regulator